MFQNKNSLEYHLLCEYKTGIVRKELDSEPLPPPWPPTSLHHNYRWKCVLNKGLPRETSVVVKPYNAVE